MCRPARGFELLGAATLHRSKSRPLDVPVCCARAADGPFGETHPGQRLLNERWDALDLAGPVRYLDTSQPVDFSDVLSYVSREIAHPRTAGI
jgi:hypothetical protein